MKMRKLLSKLVCGSLKTPDKKRDTEECAWPRPMRRENKQGLLEPPPVFPQHSDPQILILLIGMETNFILAVRVRPPLKPSDPGYELIPQRFQRSMVHVTAPTSLAVDVPQGRKLFVFDRVFPETVDQDGIWEYLSDSVSSFLQGYNVSILAYGQSGAGKSYTMGTSGPNEQSAADAMGE